MGRRRDLDGPGSDEARRFSHDNALHWLERSRFDGLRLDAVHAFLDRRAVPFLEQLSRAVHELEQELEQELERTKVLIAGRDLNDPRLIRSVEAAGLGRDAQWSDDVSAESARVPSAAGSCRRLGTPGVEVSGDVLHLPACGVGVLRTPGRSAPSAPSAFAGAASTVWFGEPS